MSETQPGGESARTLPALGVALFIAALWLVLQGLGLGATPFHSKGEPREAIVVQDIAARGDWILPRRNGAEIVRKPPLFYWLGAIAAHVRGGVDETAVRLPSALQSLAAVLLLVVLAAATGGARAALLAGVVLLTSFEWMRAATSARVDMTLALGTTASFVGLVLFELRRAPAWLALAYAGMVWGTLAKGPVAIALPVLFAVAAAAWRGGAVWLLVAYGAAAAAARSLALPPAAVIAVHLVFALAVALTLRGLAAYRPLLGLTAVAAAAALWYGLAAWRGGADFFFTQIVQENVARFTGGADSLGGHQHSPLYLFGALLAGALPWTLFLPGALRRGRRDRGVERAALLWCAVVFAFFCFAESKRSVYLLPMYPALALLTARHLDAVLAGRDAAARSGAVLGVLLWGLALVSALLATAFAAEVLGVPLVRSALDAVPAARRAAIAPAVQALAASAPALAVLLSAAALAALCGALAAGQRARVAPLLAFSIVSALLISATQRAILPAVAQADTRRTYAASLDSYAHALATRPHYDYATVFYRGGLPVVRGNTANGPSFVLIRRDDWLALDWRARRMYQAVAGMDLPKQNNQPSYLLLERIAPPSQAGAGGRGKGS